MKKSIAIIGGGPSALLLAAFLNSKKFDVTIYEKKKSLGRKFLVAGKGGFNLSHAERMDDFIDRYTPNVFLRAVLLNFTNDDLRTWLEEIGIPTFVGTSNRIYPTKGIKPIEVLHKILAILKEKKVQIKTGDKWIGWSKNNHLIFDSGATVQADYVVFALGGGSWKVTGSDGSWKDLFEDKEIKTNPFQASNCAFKIDWSSDFILKNEGKPLKNISITCDEKSQKGEVVLTRFGLEGNAIYALSPQIQNQLQDQKEAQVFIDLKPSFSLQKIKDRIQNSKEKKISDTLRKVLKLSSTQTNFLKSQLTKDEFLDLNLLAQKIKKLPLAIIATAPIDEAISTTGGIDLDEINTFFELKKMENHFCIGEMLDWNAPTGGYLLQACFSMGWWLAKYLNERS